MLNQNLQLNKSSSGYLTPQKTTSDHNSCYQQWACVNLSSLCTHNHVLLLSYLLRLVLQSNGLRSVMVKVCLYNSQISDKATVVARDPLLWLLLFYLFTSRIMSHHLYCTSLCVKFWILFNG